METLVIVVLVIAVAWFVLPRVASRRRAQDGTYGGGSGMTSWLPAWLILGGAAGREGDRGADAGAMSHGDQGDWGGGGGDAGSSFGGDGFAGGGD